MWETLWHQVKVTVLLGYYQIKAMKCFPVLSPTGRPTLHAEREEKRTLLLYLNTCILNADGRFAQNTDFIFYAQYISEVVSSVSVRSEERRVG